MDDRIMNIILIFNKFIVFLLQIHFICVDISYVDHL